jgi:hypothetical protein
MAIAELEQLPQPVDPQSVQDLNAFLELNHILTRVGQLDENLGFASLAAMCRALKVAGWLARYLSSHD